jgi:ribosomal protein L37AE/L43A
MFRKKSRRGVLHGIVIKPKRIPSCPECGALTTRKLGMWSCAGCGWKGHSPSYFGRVIFLDKTKSYECPRCHNVVKPKLREMNDGSKDECCPRCKLKLPHDLTPFPKKIVDL